MEKPSWIGEQDWIDLIEHRKSVKAVNSNRALNSVLRELEKGCALGWAVPDMIDEMANRSWRGFKAAWLSVKGNQAGLHVLWGRCDTCGKPIEEVNKYCDPCAESRGLNRNGSELTAG